MKKNTILQNITITTIGYGGVGVGEAPDGRKVLIKWSVVPHSTIDCRIIKSKKDYLLAMPIRVVSVDPERADADPRCPHYTNPLKIVTDDAVHKNGCWWCKRQLLSYPKQLELKTHLVEDSFRYVSYLLEQAPLQAIIPSPLTYQYRNKIEFSFGKYITKISNDKKAQAQREGQQEAESYKLQATQQHTWSLSLEAWSPNSWNSDFSHYHERQLGFHKQASYNHVVDVDQCYLISERLHEIYHHLKHLCQVSKLPVYDQKRHTGVLRHIVMREWFNTWDILVNLVIAHSKINSKELDILWEDFYKTILSDELLRTHCTTFILTYNDTLSDAIRRAEAETHILRWEGYIFEALQFASSWDTVSQKDITKGRHPERSEVQRSEVEACLSVDRDLSQNTEIPRSSEWQNLPTSSDLSSDIVRFRISPFSFFQTNTLAAQALFGTAASFVQLPEWKTTIMDLYCGAGTIGLSLLSQWIGTDLIGIEIVEDAIRDAKYNAELNHLSEKSYFVAGKTEDLITIDPVIKDKIAQVWLIMVDPPREGLHKDVCVFLNDLKQSYDFQLIYISCNPVTLARDLDLLVQWWRWLQTLQPVDMFPHTHHIEMISVLG